MSVTKKKHLKISNLINRKYQENKSLCGCLTELLSNCTVVVEVGLTLPAYKNCKVCLCLLRGGASLYTSHFSIHVWNTVSFECHKMCSTPGKVQMITSPRAASVFRPKTSLK